MTHVFIDPDSVNWDSYLESQEGRGKYFVGERYQRGFGIGSTILKAVSGVLLPVAKNLAKSAGEEGMKAGASVLSDLSQGKNIKESLIEHSKKGYENLAERIAQCGKGKRRKKPNKKVTTVIPSIVPIKTKRHYVDQLSF